MNRSLFIISCISIVSLSLPGCGGDDPSGTGDGTFNRPVVVMETTMGDIVVELYRDRAPMTVMNFLQYVEEEFYDGLIFHRAISGFIIQGGEYDESMKPRNTRSPILNEADNGLSNLRGTISMARTIEINSARSQFFINTVDNTALDHRDDTQAGYGYCVFGRVIEGMDVVDAISDVETTVIGMFHDVPAVPVVITRANRRW
jgi:cyclophilin family peptidyl-prolyl cis-trans isomerase